MKLAISVVLTNRQEMITHWNNNSKLIDKDILGTDVPINKTTPLGGKFLIYDTTNKSIINSIEINSPSGFVYNREEKKFFIASMRDNEIIILDENLDFLGVLKHPNFNDMHSVNFGYNSDTLIIANTGLDAILEIDLNGNTVYEWSALDNGYPNNCFGVKRILTKGINHNKIDYPTLYQTTHLNSAVYLNENTIIASLFHQGAVISINKKNSNSKQLLNQLKNPHSIYKLNNNLLMVSDTRNRRIILFDSIGQIHKTFAFNFQWIQDAFVDANHLYVVDSNASRILNYDTIKNVESTYYQFSKDWDIYQILKI